MTEKKEKIYRIGVDARMFGTSQAAGIGQYTEELVRHLVKHDTKNQYHLFLAPSAMSGFPIYAPNLSKSSVPFKHYTYQEQISYPATLRKAGLDIIHYTNFNSPIFLKGIPSVVTIHDLTLWFFSGRQHKGWLKKWLYRLVIRRTCQNAKQIIAITKKTKADIVALLGIDPKKITVIYEAASKQYKPIKDTTRVDSLKHKFDISKPYIMYVGQWRDHKNVVRLVRAFALFRRRYGFDYQLVLVGRVDDKYPAVLDTIKELGLKEDVVLTGYVPDSDLPYLYNGAELFAFPSLYEGFGLPPLEAMACGTPVVSSNTSCMPEVLGDAAQYFDPLDVESMTKTMAEVAKSYSLKRKMRLKGLKQAQQYSFDKTAKATYKVYKKILEA